MLIVFHGLLTSQALCQNPLWIPPIEEGPIFYLSEDSSSKEFLSGIQTPTYGMNGNFLAPTLIFQKDEWVQLQVTNNLSELSTMHWHGMHVPAETDGGPLTPILPGETWIVAYQVLNDAGTYWYHPHPHGQTTAQVNMGLAGMIIVRDEVESNLNLPRTYGLDDIPLIIQDKTFDENGALLPIGFGDTMMVNGTLNPVSDVPAQMIRFRALNASNGRAYNLGIEDSVNMYQIGVDDGLLEQPILVDRILISPGERVEFLLDLSQHEGDTLQLMSYGSEMPMGVTGSDVVAGVPGGMSPLNGADFPILHLQVGPPSGDSIMSIPDTLVAPYIIPDTSEVDVVRTITMTGGVGGPAVPGFLFDNTPFDMAVVNHTVTLGDTEIWEIVNETILAHPFHIHDEEFFILDRNGIPPSEQEQGPKDVVLVLPDETVRFIIQFEDFADPEISYMYHCHILPHEDEGMMGQFLVLDSTATMDLMDEKNSQISVFPNPNEGFFTASMKNWNGEQLTLRLMHITGSLIEERIFPGSYGEFVTSFAVPELAAGVYLLEIGLGKERKTIKILKQ
ncbi:MAG: multicopper oxidase domain-containing protein [Bacteroidota bacterium]